MFNTRTIVKGCFPTQLRLDKIIANGSGFSAARIIPSMCTYSFEKVVGNSFTTQVLIISGYRITNLWV